MRTMKRSGLGVVAVMGAASTLALAGTVSGGYTGLGATSRTVTTTMGASLDVFELYATFDNPADQAEAVAVGGTPSFPNMLVAGDGGFYQVTVFGAPQDRPNGQDAVNNVPNLEFDSFLSIGVRQGFTGTPGQPTIQGFNIADFNGGVPVVLTDNGGWFVAPGSPEGIAVPFPPPVGDGVSVIAPPGATFGVILGQFSVAAGNTFSGDLGRLAVFEDGESRTVENTDTPGTVFSFTRSGTGGSPAMSIAASATPDTICLGVPTEVTVTYTVTNTGDVDLENVAVSDSGCASVQFVGGDTDADSELDLSETWTFQCVSSLSTATSATALASANEVGNPAGTAQDAAMYSVTADSVTVSVADGSTCTGVDHEFCPVVNGGTPPYTYGWIQPGGVLANSECIQANVAGTYSITVTDANGCVASASATLTVTDIAVAIKSASTVCAGGTTSICASSDGQAPLTYAWSTGATTECISVGAGTYSVTVTDAGGCTGSAMTTLTETPNPIALLSAPAPLCDSTGNTLLGSVTGGTGPFTFGWTLTGAGWEITGGQGTNMITYSAGAEGVDGTFTFTVTDANGCSGSAMVTASCVACDVTVAIDPAAPSVCPGATQMVCAVPGSGVAPFSYQWNTGATTECITAGPGTYSVTVTDSLGCIGTASVTIDSFTPPAITLGSETPLCGSAGNTLTASVTGTGPYTYAWSLTGPGWSITAGDGTDTVTYTAGAPGSTGMFGLTVTDANGCSSTANTTFNCFACTLAANITPSNPGVCAGGTTELCAVPISGTAPYTYLWDNGATTECITAGVGSYSVTITDANGCTADAMRSVTLFADPTASISGSQSPFCGSTGNQLTASVTGAAPFTFEWTVAGSGWEIVAGQGTANITYTAGDNGSTGDFGLTVTDANGCTVTTGVSFGCSDCDLGVAIDPSSATICTGSDQMLCAVPTMGVEPITYAWSTGATTECITVASAGTYSVTINDATGCEASASATLEISNPPTAAPDDLTLCEGDPLPATLCANASGGAPPYQYLWSTGATTPCVVVDAAGSYSVEVTDALGCTTMATATLTIAPAPVAAPADAVVCTGEAANVCANASSGTPPYAYLWSTGATTACISAPVGSYSVTVTDASGCSATGTAEVTENAAPACAVMTPMVPPCNSSGNSITAAPTGGIPPYSYAWSVSGQGSWGITGGTNAQTATYAAGFGEATFQLTVTDSIGCSSSCSVVVTCDGGPGGACCRPFGACDDDVNEPTCQGTGGQWQGAATDCATAECPTDDPNSIGACCLASGPCWSTTFASCGGVGGTWQGAFSSCAVVTCPIPQGACCLGSTCLILEVVQCGINGGSFQGVSSTCDSCEPVSGACCLTGGACQELTQTMCNSQNGDYEGDGTTCATTVCPLPPPTGACCLTSGTCQNDRTSVMCAASGGSYQGDASTCATATCPAPPTIVGICCFPNGTCGYAFSPACVGSGGTWLGPGSCSVNACPRPTGACCFGPTCVVFERPQCLANGGTYLGNGTTCSGTSCTTLQPPASVPTAGGAVFDMAVSPIDETIIEPNTPDIVVLFQDRVQVFLNQGLDASGSWIGLSPAAPIDLAGVLTAMTVADLDGDGYEDIVITDADAGALLVLPNLGDGTFGTAIETFDERLVDATHLVAADFAGDDRTDVVATRADGSTLVFFENDGGMVFVAPAPEALDLGTFDMGAGSNAEVIETEDVPTVIWRDREITMPAPIALVATEDLNQDGRLDLIAASDEGFVFARVSTPTDTPPDCNANNVVDWLDIADAVSTDCNGNEVPDECEVIEDPAARTCLCRADVDRDGRVDGRDVITVLIAIGTCPITNGPCLADVNRDGVVTNSDLESVIAALGPCPGSGFDQLGN